MLNLCWCSDRINVLGWLVCSIYVGVLPTLNLEGQFGLQLLYILTNRTYEHLSFRDADTNAFN